MDIDPRFALTEYVVNADDFAQYALWCMNGKSNEWEQDNSGTWFQIGEVGGPLQKKMPVCMEAHWARINGMYVLFYHACSQVVDHRMVDAWLEKNCFPYEAKSKRRAHCDAQNFHHCLQYSREQRPEVKIDGFIVPPFRFFKRSIPLPIEQ